MHPTPHWLSWTVAMVIGALLTMARPSAAQEAPPPGEPEPSPFEPLEPPAEGDSEPSPEPPPVTPLPEPPPAPPTAPPTGSFPRLPTEQPEAAERARAVQAPFPEPTPPASSPPALSPASGHSMTPQTATAREEMLSKEYQDPSLGTLGVFRVGPVVGVGLPNLLSFGATLKVTRFLGAGVNVGLIPTLKIAYYGQATLSYQEYDVYARVYPFGNSFFLGAGVGYATVRGTLSNTYDLRPYQGLVEGLPDSLDYRSQGSVQTMVVTPALGMFKTFGSGFSLGVDVGAQIPIAPSQISTSTRIPANLPQQVVDQYLGPNDQQVRDTLETIGRTPIPTINLRIGWLL